MKPQKKFIVDVDFQPIDIRVTAKNKTEARKKAIRILKRKTAFSVVGKAWPSNRKQISVDEA
jgi:hypothetical protein